MGWNSWNCFACDVNEANVRAAADAMVASGLINHGWTYINIDDCWEAGRDADGNVLSNQKFPDMKALTDYVHSKGLKIGLYSSPGPKTCAGHEGSYKHEELDARRYGEWGFDYLKYDWCSYGEIVPNPDHDGFMKPYQVMRAALDKVPRDIVFSLCQYGMGNVWEWGAQVGGNCWRTTGDITDTWSSMAGIGFGQAGHEKFAGPGHWNDPDMLVVGYVGWSAKVRPTRLTPNEQYTHISLWCLLCSPLLIGCDMTKLDDFTLNLLTNDEVLDVSQDPLGRQAGRIAKNGSLEIWAKDLEDGSKAVGLFNRGEDQAEHDLEMVRPGGFPGSNAFGTSGGKRTWAGLPINFKPRFPATAWCWSKSRRRDSRAKRIGEQGLANSKSVGGLPPKGGCSGGWVGARKHRVSEFPPFNVPIQHGDIAAHRATIIEV